VTSTLPLPRVRVRHLPALHILLHGFGTFQVRAQHLIQRQHADAQQRRPLPRAFLVLGFGHARAAALLVGRLVNRLGYRGLLRVTAPLATVIYLGLWAAPGYPALVALLGALGGVQGLQVPALNALIASRASRERAGAIFGVVSSVNSIAFSGGPFLGGALARAFGLRAVFPVAALLLLAMMAVNGRATEAPRPTPTHRAEEQLADER